MVNALGSAADDIRWAGHGQSSTVCITFPKMNQNAAAHNRMTTFQKYHRNLTNYL